MLIVDDDVRNVFALTSALELHGLRVLYADNGTDGIALLRRHPEIDIVLMDAMMPDLDGNETTRRIRALPEGADLPVVFLTAKAMPGDRESSLAAGASDYVTKPVDLDELLDTIASWVAPADGRAGAARRRGGGDDDREPAQGAGRRRPAARTSSRCRRSSRGWPSRSSPSAAARTRSRSCWSTTSR